MTKSVSGVWAAMAIVVAGCSGTTTSGSSATADQACTDLAGTICDKAVACEPALVTLAYGDAATCKTRVKPSCSSAFGANGAAVKPGDVEACSNSYQSSSCADLFAGTQPASCDIHGLLMPGAACAGSTQCSGAQGYCNTPSGQTCGVCGTRVGAGAPCTKGADCQSGLVCGAGTGAAMGTCVTPGAAGAVCDAAHPCLASLVCTSGTCVKPGSAGAACTAAAQNCDATQGLFCNPVTMVCATVQFADAGGSCGFNLANQTYIACKASGFCKMAAGSTTGTCEAAAADGASCSTTNGPNCLSPAVCTNGACKIPDPAGCQ